MKVICFYWVGERWKEENIPSPNYKNLIDRVGTVDKALAARYINNLYLGVEKWADRDFEFICFTNESLNLFPSITVRNFTSLTDRGVLPRMYMFSEQAGLFGHQVLVLDLDVIIVGSLAPLMQYSGAFATRNKFKPDERHKLDGDIMSFYADVVNEALFWTPFKDDPEKVVEMTQGRERYWVRYVAGSFAERWDEICPNAVVSYKWHVKKRGVVPEGASIISCHGAPRPHQIQQKNIYQLWDRQG